VHLIVQYRANFLAILKCSVRRLERAMLMPWMADDLRKKTEPG